jgi:hypothetical protein
MVSLSLDVELAIVQVILQQLLDRGGIHDVSPELIPGAAGQALPGGRSKPAILGENPPHGDR